MTSSEGDKNIPSNIRKIADTYLNCNSKCDACLLNTIVDNDGSNICGLVGFLVLEYDKVVNMTASIN